ncbi:TPA: DUF5316 domain-containing protein [Methanosarcinaceae archaeon]|nr:DUF5316 domain-containing protein [Methanosarcinaceae archaeon]
MRNLLIINLGIIVIAAAAAFLKGDSTLFIEIIGFAGLVFCAIAGILSGVFENGYRIRTNYDIEEAGERRERNRLSRNLFCVGIFNITITFLTYKFILQRLSMI